MAPPVTSEKITLSYPIFAADFLDADTLLVGGGGGEGRSGVGNKITLLDVSKTSRTQSETSTALSILHEYTLSSTEDSCVTLAVSHSKRGSSKLLAGINSSEAQQSEGKNEHFRIFTVSKGKTPKIEPLSKHQLFSPSTRTDIYQRVLNTRDSVAAIASGTSQPGGYEIVLTSTANPKHPATRRITLSDEVADLDLSSDGKTLSYCTTDSVYTTPSSGNTRPKELATLKPGKLRCLRNLDPVRRIITVLNLPQRTGSDLVLLDASSGATVARRKLHKGIKAATSLDTCHLGDGCTAVALAGADSSIEILTIDFQDRIHSAQVFPSVHPFQITKVVFSLPPSKKKKKSAAEVEQEEEEDEDIIRLASTSIGNTVVVHTLPLGLLKSGALSTPYWQTFLTVLISLIAIVVIAIVLQAVFIARGLN